MGLEELLLNWYYKTPRGREDHYYKILEEEERRRAEYKREQAAMAYGKRTAGQYVSDDRYLRAPNDTNPVPFLQQMWTQHPQLMGQLNKEPKMTPQQYFNPTQQDLLGLMVQGGKVPYKGLL